ncbi:MAG: DUF2849 domain-containing protein [Rubrimonas sp.]|uniref:DUF2849 domain-containing protein n=1 Tax=Rubrimonas sp. TaxID=2036015 RepID=UPI002FDD1C3A
MSRGPVVLTANDLLTGEVVWADGAGGWTRALAQAAIFPGLEAAAALAEAEARSGEVVGPYLVEVQPGPPPRPKALREAIRAQGPTTLPAADRAEVR